ncbi:MAG: S-methyl-5-thioribose-1-phosphate isomerase [Deinococcales bacterium]
MKVGQKHYQTIWLSKDKRRLEIIDQRKLPFEFVIEGLENLDQVAIAIQDMHVRGAPLIGITAAYGLYIAALSAPLADQLFDKALAEAAQKLLATRPTAVNLRWALEEQLQHLKAQGRQSYEAKLEILAKHAQDLAQEDVRNCYQIGQHGLKLIQEIAKGKDGKVVNILTHCNAGWLACVDHGTATSPIYAAFDAGIPLHVWVDETRPRNQGARLTAWELGQHGIPHSIIADNTGGHLMQRGMVDMVIVGSDRTTRQGDVANKIGTYLKALAAKDNNIPFYVALPSSTLDWSLSKGHDIEIEERGSEEVTYIEGYLEAEKKLASVRLSPQDSPAVNYAFDVTPARLVTGLITERGICAAHEDAILKLYPERS